MGVQLGVLKDEPAIQNGDIEVSAADYSGEWIRLEQGSDEIIVLRSQLPELSKIIDRFLDR